MRRNFIGLNNIKKIGLSSFIILITIFSVCTYGISITRTWKIHASTSNNVSTLTSVANTRLQTKDIDDDSSVSITILQGNTDLSWHFDDDEDNDGKVLTSTEQIGLFNTAKSSDKNSFRIVQYKSGTTYPTGLSWSTYIFIMDSGHGGTLAHEVGHYCGITSHNEEGKDHRIMTLGGSSEKNTVNSSEKAEFEDGTL